MSFLLHSIEKTGRETSPVSWLWRPYLAAGKLTLLDGDPGVGKSLLTINLAARLSRALSLPDGFTPAGARRTLFLNAEDDPSDTILPRLRAAEADLEQIFVPNCHGDDEMLQFPADLSRLEGLVRERGIDLLVIDTVSAFLPDVAAGQVSATRQALAPLAQLAIRAGVAVLLVRHLVKHACANVLYRGQGSIAVAGMARTVLLAERHPRDATCQTLSVLKANLTAPPTPLAYRLVDRGGVGAVTWLSREQMPAEDAPLPAKMESPGVVKATVWLLEALAQGPRPAAELLVAARADGIRERTLEVAKRQLRIQSKVGTNTEGRRFWQWCPPEEDDFSPLEPLEAYKTFAQPDELTDAGREVLERDQYAWASRVLRGK